MEVPQMSRLSGKIALVTGAARGQGRAHAIALAAAGADIVAFDLCDDVAMAHYPMATQDDLRETVKAVEEHGRRILSAVGDVRSAEALDGAVAQALDAFGRIDVLVANAGIWDLGP